MSTFSSYASPSNPLSVTALLTAIRTELDTLKKMLLDQQASVHALQGDTGICDLILAPGFPMNAQENFTGNTIALCSDPLTTVIFSKRSDDLAYNNGNGVEVAPVGYLRGKKLHAGILISDPCEHLKSDSDLSQLLDTILRDAYDSPVVQSQLQGAVAREDLEQFLRTVNTAFRRSAALRSHWLSRWDTCKAPTKDPRGWLWNCHDEGEVAGLVNDCEYQLNADSPLHRYSNGPSSHTVHSTREQDTRG